MTLTGGIFAATELIKLGVELMDAFADNPDMTETERLALVKATQARARATADAWDDARAEAE